LYVPFPDTLAVPTVVPPDVHDVGAVDCGPNTVNVTVPDGDRPPDSVLAIDEAEMAEPTTPLPGALAVSVGDAGWTLTATSSNRYMWAADPDPEKLTEAELPVAARSVNTRCV
jgi:hypothetical protein